jgi:hypothetical protein
VGAVAGAGVALAGAYRLGSAQKGGLSADGTFAATSTAVGDALFYVENFPTSPLILTPFTDPLPVPKALAPAAAGSLTPWPSKAQQNSLNNQVHQIWPSEIPAIGDWAGGGPEPIVYKIDVMLGTHSFTTSQVLAINEQGRPTVSFDAAGKTYPAGTKRTLPASTIYGFNGSGAAGKATFPGPMINNQYGHPALVRFENHLDENPQNLDRGDFGAPDHSFLIHLHNAHTAPESDGNPHYSMRYGPQHEGYRPKDASGKRMWVDNLYLNWPAGGLDAEKQSFFWFHDHRMDHTGSNVYKGMVGLYPIYDPKNGLDMGDETKGLRLPGVRTNNPDGSFDVKYDIPLAFYDARLDDGVTVHQDIHDGMKEFPLAKNPRKHPSGGASRSTSTSPTTALSVTSSRSTARPPRC